VNLALPLRHLLDPYLDCTLCCVLASIVKSCWRDMILEERQAACATFKFAANKALEVSITEGVQGRCIWRVWNTEGSHPKVWLVLVREIVDRRRIS
jgi:hypothetical protein